MSHSEYAFAMCNRQRVAVVYSVYTLLRSFMYRFSLFQLSKRATNFTLLLLLSLSLSDIDPITRKQIRTARQAPSLCQAKAIHTHPPSLLSPTRHKQSNNDLTITCASECKRRRGDHSSLPGRFPILKKKRLFYFVPTISAAAAAIPIRGGFMSTKVLASRAFAYFQHSSTAQHYYTTTSRLVKVRSLLADVNERYGIIAVLVIQRRREKET